MKNCMKIICLISLSILVGCGPVLIGTGATGAYKVATDERTTGSMWDDAAITARINSDFIDDPLVKARTIDVDTLDGNVTLTGLVETEAESKRAAEIASSVPGVKGVTNELLIGSRTAGQAIDDEILGTRVKSRLITEEGIRSLNIDVDVYKGVVILTGIVDNEEQRRKAVGLAETAPGTVRVIDNLKVKTR